MPQEEKVQLTAEWPAVPMIRDMTISPLHHQSNKRRMQFLAEPLDLLLAHRRWNGETPSVIETLDGEGGSPANVIDRAIYAGPLIVHFGHFIAESLHRIWPRVVYPELGSIQLAYHTYERGWPPPQYVYDILSLVGVSPGEIIPIDQTTLFRELYVPAQGRLMAGATIHPQYRNIYDSFVSELPKPDVAAPFIYVSRRKHRHTGSFFGEAYLHELLEVSGFLILYPEEMTVEAMVSYLQHAEVAVFCEGSAIHNLELCGSRVPKTLVIGRRGGSAKRFSPMLQSVADEWKVSQHILSSFGITPHANQHSSIVDLKQICVDIEAFTGLLLPQFDEPTYRECVVLDLLDNVLTPIGPKAAMDTSSINAAMATFKANVLKFGLL